ncbi:hypothetical protein HHI36_017825, partial [Cryptolaemus montrouzieri]
MGSGWKRPKTTEKGRDGVDYNELKINRGVRKSGPKADPLKTRICDVVWSRGARGATKLGKGVHSAGREGGRRTTRIGVRREWG